jgi:RloB-like protein
MNRQSKSIIRKKGHRAERRRLLVVAEGTNTEVQYMQGLTQHLKTTGVSVRPVTTKGRGRDPLSVLKAAESLAREAESVDPYEEIWLVVDVDEHATLSECLRQAKKKDIPVVISNPRFEIWLLWHFQASTKFHTKNTLRDALRPYGQDAKNLTPDFPFNAYIDASVRARGTTTGPSAVGDNPSSSMNCLLDVLEDRKA